MREGWEYKKIGDIATVVSGSTPQTSVEEFWGEGHYWVTPAELDDKTVYVSKTERQITDAALAKAKLQRLPKGTVLLSSRAPIGKVAICDVDMYCNQGFKNCICSDLVYNKYLFYFLKDKKEYLNSLGRGATFKEISKGIVEKVVVPLPPKSTQLSIVSELDKLNELIQIKKEQLKDYDALAQSIFYEMFGDPVVNEKGWEVKKLGEVSIYPKERIAIDQICPNQYIGVENLIKDRGGVRFSDNLPKADVAIAYKENDILLGNIRPYLKKIWLADKVGGASGDVVIIRIKERLISPLFLFKLLSSDQFFEYDNNHTKGAKMPRGDRKTIAKFGVILPPLSLQQSFAHKIEQIERQKAEVQKTITDLETLLAARMQYWFD
jgi:putative type-1 restriction enzyme mjaXP specificity protein